MTIMKNLVALATIFFAAPSLVVGLTVPAFLATSCDVLCRCRNTGDVVPDEHQQGLAVCRSAILPH